MLHVIILGVFELVDEFNRNDSFLNASIAAANVMVALRNSFYT